jgi:hypothetical protein
VPRQIELPDFDLFHPAMIDFPCHAHARHDGYAHAHLHEALDALECGHFDGHVQRGFVASEELNYAAPERRFDTVRHEALAAEIGHIHLATLA